MATTLNIPLTTLPVGTRHFGPAALSDASTQAVLTIDRTPASGLNATPAASVFINIEQSDDGGSTWEELASETLPGGVIVRRGVTATSDDLDVGLWPGTGRQGRATVTVSGSSVAVQGSLVIS